MTAAALLLVLGAALLMQWAGMSMALGAFLAGVLLAESNFRHELEADIEPFRGLLLGLFFMGVGMGIDGGARARQLASPAPRRRPRRLVKAARHGVSSGRRARPRATALRGGLVLSPVGEFAFVLIPLGASLGLINAGQRGFLSALAAATMLIGPSP